MFRVGIIGCGLQGWRRAKAIQASGDNLVAVSDVDMQKTNALASAMKCVGSPDWHKITKDNTIDIVVVCSPNNLHAPMSIDAINHGKHVLCEKPLAINPEEAIKMINAANGKRRLLKCGFNHRYHPAIKQVKKWYDEGLIGELSFMRCRYGTCGRLGYEKDWRTSLNISGGGELLDQGIHVLDLFRWFAGAFSYVVGFNTTAFWDTSVEDNAFALLRTEKGVVASMHVSWTQWRNLFNFEVFGREGYATIEGLGGSYGVEKAILGKKSFTKPFEEQIIDYRGEDLSWYEEWKDFTLSIQNNQEPMGNGVDGLEALKLAYSLYAYQYKTNVTKIRNPV